jgi:hypothetical protein
MSTKEKTLSLRWLVLVVVTIAVSLLAWLHYRAGSQDPRTRKYTTEQWLQMVTQREHQPIAKWRGPGAASLEESRASMDSCILGFQNTPSHVLEYQLEGLLKRDPLMFLPLFDSQDPQVVLVGMYVYRNPLPDHLTKENKAKIAAAFRKLLDNPDTRMRWAAIQTLGENRWLTLDDVARGLNDETLDIRFTTGRWLKTLLQEPCYTPLDNKLLEAEPNDVERLIETKRKLAPILLEHLNDAHFYVRQFTASRFRSLFARRVKTGTGVGELSAPMLPAEIDWMRADWHTRDKTEKEWKQWWAEQGKEALRWAHPPQ